MYSGQALFIICFRFDTHKLAALKEKENEKLRDALELNKKGSIEEGGLSPAPVVHRNRSPKNLRQKRKRSPSNSSSSSSQRSRSRSLQRKRRTNERERQKDKNRSLERKRRTNERERQNDKNRVDYRHKVDDSRSQFCRDAPRRN